MRHREIEHSRRETREIITGEAHLLVDARKVLLKNRSEEALIVLEVDVDQVLVVSGAFGDATFRAIRSNSALSFGTATSTKERTFAAASRTSG
jgi:hypothetical protein